MPLRNDFNRWRAFWRHSSLSHWVNLLVVIGAIVMIWTIVSMSISNPDRYLPTPWAVLMSSGDMLYKGLLPSYFADTISRLVVGSLIGLALGIPFGLLLGINRTVAAMFYPIMNFFQSVSGIAIFPIVVIWWGNSDATVFAIILYTAFFPIAFTVLSGVREIPLRYIHAARTLGASRFQIIKDVL
ncbi:MAG: ABC transporter permease, partial [Hyphomicrobiaceae bacterium]